VNDINCRTETTSKEDDLGNSLSRPGGEQLARLRVKTQGMKHPGESFYIQDTFWRC